MEIYSIFVIFRLNFNIYNFEFERGRRCLVVHCDASPSDFYSTAMDRNERRVRRKSGPGSKCQRVIRFPRSRRRGCRERNYDIGQSVFYMI